jgi:hypothetical protein
MTRYSERGGAPGPGSADHHPQHRQSIAKEQHPQDKPFGRFAGAWREGFGYGFRDACRLAARRLPPEYWHVVEALADEYELAGSDG